MTQYASSHAAETSAAAAKAKLQHEEDGLFFQPPLYSQRAQLVHDVLQRYGCRRVVDAGCSYGDLLLFVMNACSLRHVQLTHVTAIDLDGAVLQAASQHLPFSGFSVASYTQDCTLQCVQGDLTSSATIPGSWLPYPKHLGPSDKSETSSSLLNKATECSGMLRGATVDAVFSIEVVEHIPPHLVAAYTYTIFAELGAARGARVVLLTTPNRDENTRLPRPTGEWKASTKRTELPTQRGKENAAGCDGSCENERNSIYRPWAAAPRRRHDEHFFELTRAQWRCYVQYVERCYGRYWVAAEEVLLGDGFTQGMLFLSRDEVRRGTSRVEDKMGRVRGSCYSLVSPDKGKCNDHLRRSCRRACKSSCRVAPNTDEPHKSATLQQPAPLPVRDIMKSEATQLHEEKETWLSREEAVAAFPFESIFGMSFTDYAAHFLSSFGNTNQHFSQEPTEKTLSGKCFGAPDSVANRQQNAVADTVADVSQAAYLHSCLGSNEPFTRLEHRTIEGVALWTRFCEVVRRGFSNFTSVHADDFLERSDKLKLSKNRLNTGAFTYVHFFTAHVAPLLHVLMEECTVQLLLSSLWEQRALWLRAVQEDALAWRRFVKEASRRGQPLALLVRKFDKQAAHTFYQNSAIQEQCAHTPICRVTPVSHSAAEAMRSVLEEEKCVCSRAVLLFPFPSEASACLSRCLTEGGKGDARLRAACAAGLALLEKGYVNSVGFLLMEWLFTKIDCWLRGKLLSEGHQKAFSPACMKASGAIRFGQATQTLKDLPEQLTQLLFFLVGVDVIPGVYRALQEGWGSQERHFAALWREVRAASTHLSTNTLASTLACNVLPSPCKQDEPARGSARGRRRLTATASNEEKVPNWLMQLLNSTIC